jgi:hypothetical protein
VFAVAVGFFTYQQISVPILAASEVASPTSTCKNTETEVAFDNYPGKDVVKGVTGGTDDTKHALWYQIMGINYWHCSHICVPKGTNVMEYLKGSSLAVEKAQTLTSLDKPEDILDLYNKKDASGINFSITESKAVCQGPNSKDYAPAGTKIVKGGKTIATILNRVSTYDPTKPVATTDATDAKPGIQYVNPNAPESGDGNGPAPAKASSANKTSGNNTNTNNPAAAKTTAGNADTSTLEGCWKSVSQTSANHLTAHLYPANSGQSYIPPSREEVLRNIRFELEKLHGSVGKELADEIGNADVEHTQYVEDQKSAKKSKSNPQKMLARCQAINTRLNANLSTARADVDTLAKCTKDIVTLYNSINGLGLGLISASQKSQMQPWIYSFDKIWKNYTTGGAFTVESPNYWGGSGMAKIEADNKSCNITKGVLENINKTKKGTDSDARVTVVGNIAISNADLNSAGLAWNKSTRNPISVCVYLKTGKENDKKSECKKVTTQRKDGGFWVTFNVDDATLQDLKNSKTNKIYIYAAWHSFLPGVRNIYEAIPPNQGQSVSMVSVTNTAQSQKTSYEIQIHKPIVLLGQQTTNQPVYSVKGRDMVVEELKRFMSDTGGKNCLDIDPIEQIK